MPSNKGGMVAFRALHRRALHRAVASGLLLISGWVAAGAPIAAGQQINRKLKSKVAAHYPELARRLNISGVVKIQITIAANGTVRNAKLVGGHPVLANAALDAVKNWRYEAGPEESTGIVDFRFDPAP
jgi:TonB family protein